MQMKPGPKPNRRAIAAWKQHRPEQITPLAKHLGISVPAVSKWPYVPRARLTEVARFLDVPPLALRPDTDPFESLTNPKEKA